jgi:glycine cleavage system H protein
MCIEEDAGQENKKEHKTMVVLLVIITFAAFIVIDALVNRKRVPAVPLVAAQEGEAAGAGSVDRILGGFQVPVNLKYHAGHTWVQKERKNVHKVGVDQFAAIVAGPVDGIELPKAGQWVRQGQKIFSFMRGKAKIEMISPVEGEVTEVNAEVLANPGLLREDPYGRGWLMTVYEPDEDGPTRNLLPANLVKSWMAAASESFYRLQPQLAGATAADGGLAVQDATAAMPAEEWQKLGRELFLS